MHIWKQLNFVVFAPILIICMGAHALIVDSIKQHIFMKVEAKTAI